MSTTQRCHADSSDAELLELWCSQRDQQAFEFLVERYAPLVHNTCLRSWSGNSARSEEATQAVFIIFTQKAAQIKNADRLPGWLHRTAVNTVRMQQRSERNEQRKKRALTQEQELSLDPVINDAWQELRPQLDQAINSLSNTLRQTIILHYYEGQSVSAIARRTNASDSAIKKRLHEGRARLRQYFKRAGYTASLAWLGTALQAEVTPVCSATITASCFEASAPLHIPGALSIAQGVMKTMFITKIKAATVAALLICGSSAALVYAADSGDSDASESKKPEITVVAGTQASAAGKSKTENGAAQNPGATDPSGGRIIPGTTNPAGAQNNPNAADPIANNGNRQIIDNGGMVMGGAVNNNPVNRVTLSLNNTPLEDAIKKLSLVSGLKIKLGEKVDTTATVSATFKGQPDTTALSMIAALSGNTVSKRDDGSYLLNPAKKSNIRKKSNTAAGSEPEF